MTNDEAEKVGRLVALILDNRYARPQLIKTTEFREVITMLEPRLMEVVDVYAERDGRKARVRDLQTRE
jgi:hypothetical protein